MIGCSVGWLVGRLVGWSVGRLVGWMTGWLDDWLVDVFLCLCSGADRVRVESRGPEERTVQRDQRVVLDPLVRLEPLDLLERR